MGDVIGMLVMVALVALLLLVLGAIIRFSIISPLRTRGAADRLRHPDLPGVEEFCGLHLPRELAEFYVSSPLAGMRELHLVDGRNATPRAWFIGAFVPLTLVDIREARAICNVPGVPIADDGNKGCFYVASDGTIRLRSPNLVEGDTVVAESIVALQAMTPAAGEAG